MNLDSESRPIPTIIGESPATIEETNQIVRKEWSLVRAVLLGPWLPAGTASKTQHVSLRSAYAIHFLAAMAAVFAILVLASAAETDGALTFDGVAGRVLHNIEVIASEFADNPGEATLITGIIIAVIELGFALLSVLIASWGAADEPLSASYRHSFRRVWLWTSHATTGIVVVGIALVTLEQIEWHYSRADPFTFDTPLPQPPKNSDPTSQTWKDFNSASRAWQSEHELAWQAYVARRSWVIEYMSVLMADAVVAGIIWVLWGLLRALGAGRSVIPVARPPQCEFCGYNLTGSSADGRCPECGEPVVASLGPDHRRGTPWHYRKQLGCWRAYRDVTSMAVMNPRQLGRMIFVHDTPGDHRFFLALHVPLLFLVGVIGTVMFFIAEGNWAWRPHESEEMWIAASILGLVTLLLSFGLMLLTTTIIARRLGRAHRRNLLAGTIQVSAYSALLLPLWAAMACILCVSFEVYKDLYADIGRMIDIQEEVLMFTVFLIVNGVCWIFYARHIARGTAALRYANR